LGADGGVVGGGIFAAVDLIDIGRVPTSGLAATLGRRGGASATDCFGDGARSPKSGAAPPSLASLAGCSSGGRVSGRTLSEGSASGGSWLRGSALDSSLLCDSWLGGSLSGACGSAEGLPGAGSPRVGETADGVSGGLTCGCGCRGAPEAGLESDAGAPASCWVGDKSAVGGRD